MKRVFFFFLFGNFTTGSPEDSRVAEAATTTLDVWNPKLNSLEFPCRLTRIKKSRSGPAASPTRVGQNIDRVVSFYEFQ